MPDLKTEEIEKIMRPYRSLLCISGEGIAGWMRYLGPSADPAALLAIDELFRAPQLKDAGILEQTDYTGRSGCCYVMELGIRQALPRVISVLRRGIFLYAKEKNAILKIPVYEGFLRYYYPDYENYWYFPAEDTAIHKNLALYSDRSHRQKATVDTAYTRIDAAAATGWGEKERYDYCLNVLRHLLT